MKGERKASDEDSDTLLAIHILDLVSAGVPYHIIDPYEDVVPDKILAKWVAISAVRQENAEKNHQNEIAAMQSRSRR